MCSTLFKCFVLFALLVTVSCLSAAVLADEGDKPAPKSFEIVKEVWHTPFKDQGYSGMCWSFSTTSFLESEAYRLERGEFELSQLFTVYHAYLEKAQKYARRHGSGVFQEGGLPHDVIYIMKKYGTVPLKSYTGLKQDITLHDHRELYPLLSGLMQGVIKVGKKGNLKSNWSSGTLESNWVDDLRDIMDNHLGPIPETARHKGKNMTPKAFVDEVLDLPFDDFIEITSYSYLPLYGTGELALRDNWLHYAHYYNVPLEDYIAIIDHALKNGYSLVFDLHTTSELYKSLTGYAELDAELEGSTIDQDTRDTMLENWTTKDQHLVHAVGIAKDAGGKKYYFTKDSVGPEQGPFASLEYLSENFIRAKALFFMVHKDGVPDRLKKKMGLE